MSNNFIGTGGIFIGAAGSAQLEHGRYTLKSRANWVYCALEAGEATLHWADSPLRLTADCAVFLPPCPLEMTLHVCAPTRMYWLRLDGSQAPELVRLCGAYLTRPLPQHTVLSQMLLIKQIVRLVTRYTGSNAAGFQLMQLLYAMLSVQCEQPIAPGASISGEILRVLDALRENHYRDNLSLKQMAEMAKLPLETFRKRFVSEVGMSPLQYVLACKIARAKVLLLTPEWSVKAVAAEVGMDDPYRFSKQFKAIVGLSPVDFRKLSAEPLDAHHSKESQ